MPQLFFLIVVNEGLGRFTIVHFDREILCFFIGVVPLITEHFFLFQRVLRIRKSLVFIFY